jgi:iron complex outermembrane receptor protein
MKRKRKIDFYRTVLSVTAAALLGLLPVTAIHAQIEDTEESRATDAADSGSALDEVVLPSAEVRAQRETAEHVSQEQMTERGDTTLFEAMRWIPGIVTFGSHPGTDQGAMGVRGISGGSHDVDYMTIMQDGAPLSDLGGIDGGSGGRLDYFGMLTGGLESIDVAKGYTSVLLGPNIMAGVLMMRTAKPKRLFELNARAGVDLDAGGFSATSETLTVGSRFGMFYARAGVQEKYMDHWRMPEDFEPTNTQGKTDNIEQPQKAGNRIFSKSNSLGANIMFGVNPFDTLDVWATYAYSSRDILDGGWTPVPVSNSIVPAMPNDMLDPRTSLFMGSFPYRRRHDATLHAEWTPTGKLNLGLLGYFNLYDQERRSIFSPSGRPFGDPATIWPLYEADSYTISYLSTNAFGINLQGGYAINDMHKIEGAVQFRQNNFEEWGDGLGVREEPERSDDHLKASYRDNIYFFGAEYTINPVKAFTGIVGFGLDMNDPQKLDRWTNTNRNPAGVYTHTPQETELSSFIAMPQWNLGAFYDLTEQHELHFTYAKKNRFPSFTERGDAGAASWRNVTLEPNLDLKPQEVHHFEVGYKGYFLERVRLTSALYTNYELNKIAIVTLDPGSPPTQPGGADGTPPKGQYRNINENLYYGLELGTELVLNDFFSMGGNFSLSKSKVLYNAANDDPGTSADYSIIGLSPLFVTNGYVSISPFAGMDIKGIDDIRIIPRFEYIGTRYYPSSAGNQISESAKASKILDDYALLHLGIIVDIAEHYSASFSVNNILDEIYYTAPFYPGAGRSFNISLGAKF